MPFLPIPWIKKVDVAVKVQEAYLKPRFEPVEALESDPPFLKKIRIC
jgi:hypothetical protein